MSRLSSPDLLTDPGREALLSRLSGEFGDAIVGSHIVPDDDIWVRVDRGVWADVAEYLRVSLGFSYFNFLSAIDWLPSPYGRSMDSRVDTIIEGADAPEAEPMEQGLAGGHTRFQILARVNNLESKIGVSLKADVPDDDLSIATWVDTYPGANWHERECWEMFGIEFAQHPGLRHIYLPGAFEGNPMRKDYPLLARMVKPWPGIVDVEAMPGDGEDAS